MTELELRAQIDELFLLQRVALRVATLFERGVQPPIQHPLDDAYLFGRFLALGTRGHRIGLLLQMQDVRPLFALLGGTERRDVVTDFDRIEP